ncbi:MAG: hypothetical protein ABJB66_01325 [Gemmatimonadaceae bacterium]
MAPIGLEQIAALVQPFADLYANSKALSATTTVVHLGGLLGGGGLAIATDRTVLRTSKFDGLAQRNVLTDLSSTHRLVVTALVAIVLSGLVFLSADIKTFGVSRVYWTKMAVVGLLLLNGLRLWGIESRLKASAALGDEIEPLPDNEWRALRQSATVSLLFWFSIMTLGVVLANS